MIIYNLSKKIFLRIDPLQSFLCRFLMGTSFRIANALRDIDSSNRHFRIKNNVIISIFFFKICDEIDINLIFVSPLNHPRFEILFYNSQRWYIQIRFNTTSCMNPKALLYPLSK